MWSWKRRGVKVCGGVRAGIRCRMLCLYGCSSKTLGEARRMCAAEGRERGGGHTSARMYSPPPQTPYTCLPPPAAFPRTFATESFSFSPLMQKTGSSAVVRSPIPSSSSPSPGLSFLSQTPDLSCVAVRPLPFVVLELTASHAFPPKRVALEDTTTALAAGNKPVRSLVRRGGARGGVERMERAVSNRTS